ncbi:type II secretion system F family protein [Pseudogemmobacter humi]|uniref:Bacterial type II secretion system protein F domain protein n=1 Tax=Pseudogemmobacter humi TaxID=2483812 RepID=A0A3P5WCC9_9RHOB|nr:type II secretion system F family protein [Pseudogemmobacter humi]VDC21153.1 Bacterial type II secretion system protein F domain protein [Pseudogemmobacter humi]
MVLSHILSLMLGFGLLLLTAAAGMALSENYRKLQRAVIRRFSGSVETAGPEDRDRAAGQQALRREDPPRWWARVIKVAPGRDNLAAFGTEMRRITLVLVLSVTTLVAILANAATGTNLLLGALAGLLVSAVIWRFWAGLRFRRRLAAIDDAVPEALDMIVRSLRVGLPVASAIQSVGQELTAPLSDEFAETSRRISYGQDPVRALRDMAERCQNQNLRFFAAAVSIQSASGGNLAEVIERLCAIARGRQQMRRKVRSITAEAKWSGRFLSFFPLLATTMLLAINPGYFEEISDKPFFLPMLAVVGGLLTLNILFMRWLVKIE